MAKILFVGARSFSGYWFVKELVANGHDVTLCLRGSTLDSLEDQDFFIQLHELTNSCETVYNAEIGSSTFIQAIEEGHFDILCIHAAFSTNYRSLEFDFIDALKNNTSGISLFIESFKNKGGTGVVLTNSYFQPSESSATAHPAVYPYGLSKELTFQTYKYYTQLHDLSFGAYYLANPFGIYETRGISKYLLNQWFTNSPAKINFPNIVRDNIPVTFAAREYHKLVQSVFYCSHICGIISKPSFYAESLNEFAKRLKQEVQRRISLECELDIPLNHPAIQEPLILQNDEDVKTEYVNDVDSFWEDYIGTYSQER
ncbi:MAG: hypothetical protein MK080_01785 [Opitutales bacterium]|nr:hypothetical protein [Opitutales bacterium]